MHNWYCSGMTSLDVQDGRVLKMHEVQIGDMVQTLMPDGSISFQEIYLLSHADAIQQAVFISVKHVS